MRVEQLKQLIEIVQQESMTKAAAKLNITQPALSTSMKNLEKAVGFQIFSRNGKKLKLTEQGEELYICSKRIAKELDIIDNIHQHSDVIKHTINISNSFSVLAKDTLIDLYNRYSKEKITCRFEDCSVTSSIDNVYSGISEIGIIRYPVYKQSHLNRIFESKNIEHHIFTYENACVVTGRKNPLYYIENDYIGIQHIRKYNFITYINEIHDNMWMNFLKDLRIDYSEISLANVGHVMEAVRKTDLLFIDTRKDHTHKDWYNDIRYIELKPEVPCALAYIKLKNRQLSDIAASYIALLEKRIYEWRNN